MADTSKVPTWPERFTAADAAFLLWSKVPAGQLPSLLARLELGDITATAQEAPLSFYEGGKLIAVSRPGEAQDLFFFLPPDAEADVEQLNGTNEPIYAYNDDHGATLNGAATLEYVRTFFHFVRGQLGSFLLVEKVEGIDWRTDAPAEIKAKVASLIVPLTARGAHRSGLLRNTVTVVFKNALFKTDIYIAPRRIQDVTLPGNEFPVNFSIGQLALHGEDLLIDDLPVNG